MFAKSGLLVVVVQAALLLCSVEARIWLLERDGRAIYARRFGQEQPEVLTEIRAACGGGVCDTLAGEAVSHHPNISFQLPRLLGTLLRRLKICGRLTCCRSFGYLGRSIIGGPTRMFAAGHGR